MNAARVALQDTDFDRLRDLIHARSGIEIRPIHRLGLETRLGLRLQELRIDSFDHYLQLLTTGPFQADEFNRLLERSQFSESCFFRHARQLQYLRRVVLPRLLRARDRRRHIRIWSAGCAAGEEPYSIAITLHHGLESILPDWHIEILGTDISAHALERAAQGIYPPLALPAVHLDLKRRYFTQEGGMLHLDHEVRSMVAFRKHNLTDSLSARRFGRWDVIFCRDALPWFDPETREDVVLTLADQLADDGFLFLGPDERLRHPSIPFRPVDPRVGGVHAKTTPETLSAA